MSENENRCQVLEKPYVHRNITYIKCLVLGTPIRGGIIVEQESIHGPQIWIRTGVDWVGLAVYEGVKRGLS